MTNQNSPLLLSKAWLTMCSGSFWKNRPLSLKGYIPRLPWMLETWTALWCCNSSCRPNGGMLNKGQFTQGTKSHHALRFHSQFQTYDFLDFFHLILQLLQITESSEGKTVDSLLCILYTLRLLSDVVKLCHLPERERLSLYPNRKACIYFLQRERKL
jgi:hypothetical protein